MINTSSPLIERRNYSVGIPVVTSVTNHQFSNPFYALYIGVSGDVIVDLGDSTQITFKAVPVGMLNIFGTQVYKVGTTATNIVALS